MQRRDADFLDRLTVLRRRVADVFVEPPARVPGGDVAHIAVAGDLGDHGGGGDRGAGRVALHHSPVRDGAGVEAEAVDETDRLLRWWRQPLQRQRERFDVGHVQAAAVDPGRAADDDTDPLRRSQHARVHLQAVGLGHLLGVVQAAEGAPVGVREALVVEQHGSCDQRSGETAATGLVGTGDVAAAEPAIEGEETPAAGQPPAVELPFRGLRARRFGLGASRWQRPLQ